jgi:hypothetical protein
VLSEGHRNDVLRARGITDRVMDHREKGRPRYASVRTWEEERALNPAAERWHVPLFRQSAAVLINRWDIEGKPLPPYLRFDRAVAPDPRFPRRRTKYIQPSRDVSEPKLIDVHPLARELLLNDPPAIYLCLEGSLKADALLSHGHAALSVPSVTLWQVSAEQLRLYLPMVKKAPVVYVVPDSDYHFRGREKDGRPLLPHNKRHVRYQTDRCIQWLKKQGVRTATYCVPPYWSYEEARDRGLDEPAEDRFKIGIDDHLARGGNLLPWHREANPVGVHMWRWTTPNRFELPTLLRQRKDRAIERDRRVALWLWENHGPEGVYDPSDAWTALEMTQRTLHRATQSLQERGILYLWHGQLTETDDGALMQTPHLYSFTLNLLTDRAGQYLDAWEPRVRVQLESAMRVRSP